MYQVVSMRVLRVKPSCIDSETSSKLVGRVQMVPEREKGFAMDQSVLGLDQVIGRAMRG